MNTKASVLASLLAVLAVLVALTMMWSPLSVATEQGDEFYLYQLEVFCDNSQVATAVFNVTGSGKMGTKVVCAGRCSGRVVALKDVLAGLPAKVSKGFNAQVETHEQKATAGMARSVVNCTREEEPAKSTCDRGKACEAIAAALKSIAKYDGTILGTLPGAFAEMMSEVSRQIQNLSEALACRFNPGHDAADKRILNDFIGQLLKDQNAFHRSGSGAKLPNKISCTKGLGDVSSSECHDYETLQRIRENLSTFAGVLGCKGSQQGNRSVPKSDCKELSNGVLDGLTTFFDELDKAKPKKQIGSGDSYDQVADGIEGALQQLEEEALEIEGTGATGSQQYKDLQGKIGKLKKLLDVWAKIKASSCLPKEVEQLLRKLASEKKAGTEHKATCTELCDATADWHVKVTGLPNQRSAFFKTCTLACF